MNRPRSHLRYLVPMALAAAFCGTVLKQVQADERFSDVLFEGELRLGHDWRGGDALNSSFGPPDEDERFGLLGGSLLSAFAPTPDVLLQLEFDAEARTGPDTSGGVPVDDTFESAFQFAGQAAWRHQDWLIGAFVGVGQTAITSDSPFDELDADHWLAGGTVRHVFANSALGLQAGVFDSSQDDPEALSNAVFARVIGEAFFHDGHTRLAADFAYGEGDQDPDSGSGPDPVSALAWGLEIEHQFATHHGNAGLSAFVSYRGLRIVEDSSSSFKETTTDTIFFAGLRLRTGAGDLRDRSRRSLPRAPALYRWIGATPAVD